MIIFYTGEPNIGAISEKIKEKHCDNFNKIDDGFAFSQGHLRIVIFAKDGAKVPGEYSDRVISIEDLSGRVIDEFAKITAGLVSNVALRSLAVLRDNTHRIMGRLGPEMDPPYLAHRALLPNPGDAMNHVVDIIASEFHSLLDTYEVGEKANLRFIKAWIDMKNGERSSFEVEVGKDDIKSVDSAVIYELQNVGIEKSNWFGRLSNKKQENIYKTLTQTFCAEGADATELDHRFAILTSLKNRYGRSEHKPILTLGTIIKSESSGSSNESGKFWLCVQPRCDSVRIRGARNFFFLPLEVVDGDTKFDLVLEDKENKFKKLRIHYKIYESANFEFVPDGSEEQVIRAKEENKKFVFYTTDKTRFEWVSELKSEHAQRIANDFAAKLSRVGLDESEWLRRWADRRD